MKASFQLFVAGDTQASSRSVSSLRGLCARVFGDAHEIQVIDVLERPDLADEARILAVPTVVKLAPPPQRRAIGDLSDTERLAAALDLLPPDTEPVDSDAGGSA